MLAKKPRGHISMDVPYFESVLHAKICGKFRCGHLTFKVLVQITISPRPSWSKKRKNFCRL